MWHRWLGLAVALFAVILSITGLMLNHTESLRLDERRVESSWLLALYGISTPPLVKAYSAGEHWISQWGGQLFLDAEPLAGSTGLRGAAEGAGMTVAATGEGLLLLAPSGELVERLPMPGVQAIGRAEGNLVARTDEGLLRADNQLIGWSPVTGMAGVQWSQESALPERLRLAVERHLKGEGLPLERVVLDLHSGRILGTAGVLLMDAAALILLFSAASGVWLWLRHRLRRRA
jgi:hypothetical protein